MDRLTLKYLSFGSYIKLVTLGALGFGLTFGVLGFLISIFVPSATTTNIATEHFNGITAGIMILILFPIVYTLAFLIFSVIFYPFFALILKFFKGINIKGIIANNVNPVQILQEELENTNDNVIN